MGNSSFAETRSFANGATADGTGDTRRYLSMKEGQDFKIITVTDSHLNGQGGTDVLLKYLELLISSHKPDLVVFNGDNVDNGVTSDSTVNDIKYRDLNYLEQVFQFLEEKRQHWTLILGNHDRDPGIQNWPAGLKAQNDLAVAYSDGTKGVYGLYREAEAGYEEVLAWQAYADDDLTEWHNARYGNYAVNIKDGDKIVYSLIMMDSGQHETRGSDNNGYLKEYQVQWYQNYMKSLAEDVYGEFDLMSGKYVPNLIFIHQPTPEFVFAAQQALGESGMGTVPARYGFGVNEESNLAAIQREKINTGLFAAAKSLGATDIYCGHNHSINSTILYDGIRLNYLNRMGRREGESASWPDNRIGFSKMITIKAGTYEVENCFALWDGTTTTSHSEALNHVQPK